MNLRFSLSRFATFFICMAVALVSVALVPRSHWFALPALLASGFVLLGLRDLAQERHSVLRNYPIIGHIRWLVELIRPEIRQYLLEADEEAVPFSRSQRSLVYRRAKGIAGEHAFGTLLDVYRDGYELIGHSMQPAKHVDATSFRITIGGPQCDRPYSASVLNISAMSFGALSANAIRALNKGAKIGGFSHDTGEGSISPYHREHGGDIVWQIGSGYFGCRDEHGNFSPDRFAAQATSDQVKMIEIKLSQGAKPGHGGILPAAKVTPEISETRGVPVGQDCVSPSAHTAFSTPLEMMAFVAQLRALSGGKPIGFKLCLGHPWEFMGVVKAMLATGIYVDFIVVDGAEGGTGAAPVEFSDHMGMPMREGLLLVHNTLTGAGIRDRIKIGVAGRVVSAFDLASLFAIGADWANAARGFMFAIGCIQSLSCNTNHCPTGIATQDPLRQRALVVPDKAERVARFHANTLHALGEMLAAAGLSHPDELGPRHLVRRTSRSEVRQFSQIHNLVKPGTLIDGTCDHEFYRQNWEQAKAEAFN
ncbi:FMN-binding glutamate synthase family protein [Sphingomonas sp.]|uniref:FMN-binding glutamate synthase family protein n=1 Tax=Sphingomonas sp. TaxID=28214 RepID=UPI000DB5782B|nr:FMN-binding glutamate synthase family protein [Sphingomonas sp.]PZU07985.1 MAG: FMN-binding glutamate synthase family protein [Sphingomonas sp.]